MPEVQQRTFPIRAEIRNVTTLECRKLKGHQRHRTAVPWSCISQGGMQVQLGDTSARGSTQCLALCLLRICPGEIGVRMPERAYAQKQSRQRRRRSRELLMVETNRGLNHAVSVDGLYTKVPKPYLAACSKPLMGSRREYKRCRRLITLCCSHTHEGLGLVQSLQDARYLHHH